MLSVSVESATECRIGDNETCFALCISAARNSLPFLCHSKNPPLAARQASLVLRDPLVAHPLGSHLFDGDLFRGGTEHSRCQNTCKHSWREAKLAVMLSRCCVTHGVLSHIFRWREEGRGEEGFLLLASVIRRRFMDVTSVLSVCHAV